MHLSRTSIWNSASPYAYNAIDLNRQFPSMAISLTSKLRFSWSAFLKLLSSVFQSISFSSLGSPLKFFELRFSYEAHIYSLMLGLWQILFFCSLKDYSWSVWPSYWLKILGPLWRLFYWPDMKPNDVSTAWFWTTLLPNKVFWVELGHLIVRD